MINWTQMNDRTEWFSWANRSKWHDTELTVLDGVVTRHELKTGRDQYMTAPVSEGREIYLLSLFLSLALTVIDNTWWIFDNKYIRKRYQAWRRTFFLLLQGNKTKQTLIYRWKATLHTDKFNITTCDCLTCKLASEVWFLYRVGTVGYFDTRFSWKVLETIFK